jgi:PKD repeat protein
MTSVETAWDFDYDGSTFTVDASGTLEPEHTYTTTGAYTVALRVTDNLGVQRLDTLQVTIVNARPVISATDEVTSTQGQPAQFHASYSCADPATIEWDFDVDDDFSPDSEATGNLDPTHTYIEAGVYLAQVRVTNNVGGAAEIHSFKVTVQDVPPTANVTDGGPTNEHDQYWVYVQNVTDVNPLAYFDYLADWEDTGEFERVPDSRRQLLPDGLRFWYVFDDNDEVVDRPVTVRILDYEGGFTDYTLQPNITNVATQAAYFRPSGGAGVPIGPGVPIQFIDVTDPSHADNVAGFTYFYQVDYGAWISSSEPNFVLPDYTPDPPGTSTIVRGYVRDKDGDDSPIYQATVQIKGSGNILINHGSGSIQATWTGGSATLAPNQWWNGVGANLHVTLLTNGANYTIQTNADFAGVHYAAGVQPTYVCIQTTVYDVTGTTKHPDSPEGIQPYFVGWGHIGPVEVPGPGPTGTPMTLRVFARGNLDRIVGPSYFGLEGINAIEVECLNLLNSITGIDSIQGLHARYLLGDDLADVVRVNTGIAGLGAGKINARILTDAFFDESDLSLTLDLGHLGAANPLDTDEFALGTVRGDVTKLQANRFAGELAFIGPVGATRLFVGDPQPNAEVSGLTGGLVDWLIFDSLVTELTPLVELFTITLSTPVGPYAENFWGSLKDQEQANWLRNIEKYEVHHTLPQGGQAKTLKARFLKERNIDIDAAQYLRGVHHDVHTKITNQWIRWQKQEMKAIGLNFNSQEDCARFWKRVDLKKVEEFATAIDSKYSKWWLKPGLTAREVKDIYLKVNDKAKIRRFKLGEGSRARGLFPKVAGALAVFALFDEATFLKNIVDHPAGADVQWATLEGHMENMIEASFTNPRLPDQNIRNLHTKTRAYLVALGANENAVNAVTTTFVTWMLARGIDPF